MSGHSHWAGIKHRKGINDAIRGKIFTKHGKLLAIAARDGGGNPETNFALKLAIDRAKGENMPKENIERAIKRGTGELKGNAIEEIIYEAVGPGNIMMLVKTMTDNRNRTVGELKSILTKAGGKLAEQGSAMWNFEKVGMIRISLDGKNIDEAEMAAIEAGARDTETDEQTLLVFTKAEELQNTQNKLLEKGFSVADAGLFFIPKMKIEISPDVKIDYERLLETLDDQDDVQEIYDNL